MSRRGAHASRGRGKPSSDRDGDLQMGDAPNTAARFDPYSSGRNRGRHIRQDAGTVSHRLKEIDIQITGCQGASTDDLVAFLLRKCRVKIGHIRGGADKIVCSVYSPGDAATLLKASGIRFAGHVLQMTQITMSALSTMSKSHTPERLHVDSRQTVETLRQFLSTRYSAEIKMLDLSRIAQDPVLANFGIVANTSTSSKLFMALMKLVSDEKIEVISVSLESNNLKDLVGVSTLAQHVPKLKNLSLANNALRHYKDLDVWSSKSKLSDLQELILSGNPVRELEIEKNREVEYRSEITKRFPSLRLLDGQPIAQGISFDVDDVVKSADTRTALPAVISADFYETPTVHQTAMNFLGKFFRAYDTDRSSLRQFYADNTIFSMSINTIAPRKKVAGAFAAAAWNQYTNSSRNLTRISALDSRISRSNVGWIQIFQALKNLPTSTHDLTDASLFCVDAWSFPTSENNVHIQICSHGEFTEKSAHTKQAIRRSFDRTFVLGPAVDGQGVDGVVIKSDLLLLRSWGGSEAWKSTTRSTASNAETVPPAAKAKDITDQQLEILKSLRSQTGLNAHYAGMCLVQMNWDLAAAIQITQGLKLKNELPAEAFLD